MPSMTSIYPRLTPAPMRGGDALARTGGSHATRGTDVEARTRVTVIGDNPAIRDRCDDVLTLAGYQVTSSTRRDAPGLLGRHPFDVVLADIDGGADGAADAVAGRALLSATLTSNPAALVIVLAGAAAMSACADLLKSGAWDCLPKPFSAAHLEAVVSRAAQVAQGRGDPAAQGRGDTSTGAAPATGTAGGHHEVTMLGTSPTFHKVVELAQQVAATDVPVLITGEPGTGKSLLAEFIHSRSRRAGHPFVVVRCASLPGLLLEDELFGHRPGAMPGAREEKTGLFEAANGGTVHLGGLTEMPTQVQSKLLGLLEDGAIGRVGGTPRDATVDVRIIAAMDMDPDQAVRAGALRENLLYRLRVVSIHLLPLRARREDIPLLAEHYLRTYWAERHGPGPSCPELSDEAQQALAAHPWPGNVRELCQVMRQLAQRAAPAAVVSAADVPLASDDLATRAAVDLPLLAPHVLEMAYHPAREYVTAQFEVQYLTGLLERAGGNMSEAARIAGVDRTTLYRLMDRHGLQRNPHIGLVAAREGWITPRSATPSGAPLIGAPDTDRHDAGEN